MRYGRPAARKQAEHELEMALEAAAQAADRHESKHSIVRRVFNDSPHFFRSLAKFWFLERMLKILEKVQRRSMPDNQLLLPGIKLPPVVKLLRPNPESKRAQKPERLPLLELTLPQLLEYRKELVRSLEPAHNRKVQEVDKAIALMRKYAPRSRKATLREAVEKYGQQKLALEANS